MLYYFCFWQDKAVFTIISGIFTAKQFQMVLL